MFTRKSLLAAASVATLTMFIAVSAHAWGSHTNFIRFSGAVALPGVTLRPGTYIFELPSGTGRDIVQVRSRDRSKVFYMGFTIPVERPRDQRSDRIVMLDEASRGEAPRVVAWFPDGESLGHRFVY